MAAALNLFKQRQTIGKAVISEFPGHSMEHWPDMGHRNS